MARDIIGADLQQPSTKPIFLGLSAVFLIYFLTYSMILGLSIASPMIAADLNGMDLFAWAISIPALAMAFATLLFGKLSDMYGRRTILLTSLSFFIAGSILAALSQSFIFNIFARVINGLGFGALSTLCNSVIGDLYADPVKRSKWTGLLNISAFVSSAIAPTAVGIITDNLSWRYFFWATVPVALICIALVVIGLPARKEHTKHKMDFAGAFLLLVASSSMILGISFVDRNAWFSFHVLGLLIISLVFWYLFISVERKAREPILDPQVFTNRTFLTAAIAAFLSFFGMIGIMNYFPLFLQGVQGTSAKISGAVLTPFSTVMAVMAICAGLLVARTKRYKWLLTMSYALVTAAMFFLVFFNRATPLWFGVVVMILAGLGVGSIPTINILLVQFALPKRFRGISIAAIFFVVAIGTASAPAILGPPMNVTYQKKLANLLPRDLTRHVDAATLESIADPSVLMSRNALIELKTACNRIEETNPMLFDQTVEAIRSALQSGLRVLFLISAIAVLIGLLIILTIPEVSMDVEVQEKNPG